LRFRNNILNNKIQEQMTVILRDGNVLYKIIR